MLIKLMCVVLAVQVPALDESKDKTTRIPGYEGDVKKVVDRALETYGKVKTYQDRAIVDREMIVADMPPQQDEETVTLAFEKPNRVALDSSELAIYCDGKKLVKQIKPFEQYVVADAPKPFELTGDVAENMRSYLKERQPVFPVVTGLDENVEGLFPGVKKFTGIKAETIDERPGKRVEGVMVEKNLTDQEEEVPFSAWFDDKSGLLGQYRMDVTNVSKANAPAYARSQIKKASVVIRIEDVKINEKIADKRFDFDPGTYDEQVSEFSQPRPDAMQRKLVGKPAPPIVGEDLDGKSFKLENYEGKVVLLDFWASYCGPCIMAMPDLQRISKDYADKNVVVIGVNSDPPPNMDRVRKILDKQGVTYRQVKDPRGEASAAYRVSGIPCLVIVDQKGVVRDIHNGYAPDGGRGLRTAIDRLLGK